MRILHILSSVNPEAGGPMEALRHYGQRVQAMGHHVEVLTLDGPAEPHLSNFPLPVCAIGPSVGGYAYNPRLTGWLRGNATRFDAVIVHGVWQYHGLGAWQVLRRSQIPYFVFTHGMLDPWFKTTYPLKHLKKSIYWFLAGRRLLRDARAVLFTSEEERRLARGSFARYRAREAVVDYGTSAPPPNTEELRSTFFHAFPELARRRLLLFLGRIHPKKGCDLLIEAFGRIANEEESLHLVIAGPDQDGWKADLRSRAVQLGLQSRIAFPGMLNGDLKWGAFYAAEAFVLPSHQENFGVAVAEALGCGLPVLISDKVNIWREVKGDGAAFVASDTVDGIEEGLRGWLCLPMSSRNAMRRQAQECFERRFTADATARSLLGVLQEHAH